MSLAAAWRRQGAWATAATLLVPGVLTLAVFTVLLGGNFRGLGALGQVFTGPKVPEARLAASTVPNRHHVARLPTVPVLRGAGFGLGARSGGAAAPSRAVRAAPRIPVAGIPPRRTGGPAGTLPSPSPTARPVAPGGSPPSPVRQIGEQVAGNVGRAPVVGPAGQDAVTHVLDTVAPPPPVARAAPHPLPLP